MVQGLVYRAINLTDRLSLPHDPGGPDARVVLLSEQEVRGCVRVAAVLGLLEVQQSQLMPLPMQFCGPERHWYRGIILFAESIALVLNTAWVLQE
jgi:chemotaxis signal transduction protein